MPREGVSMKQEIHRYQGDDGLEVTWDKVRCIHFAACVHTLPNVFDPQARPWVEPEAASDEEVAEAVRLCPTGALAVHGTGEPAGPQLTNTLEVADSGPIFVRGDLELRSSEREVLLEELGRPRGVGCGLALVSPRRAAKPTRSGLPTPPQTA